MNEGNVVASPLSIAGALHMLAAGAAGDTRYQICEKGLGLDPEIFGTRKGVSHKESIFSFRSLIEDDIDVGEGKSHPHNVVTNTSVTTLQAMRNSVKGLGIRIQ